MKMKSISPIFKPISVGIDFGTFKSAIAYWALGKKGPELVIVRPEDKEDPYQSRSLPTRISLSNHNDGGFYMILDNGQFQERPDEKGVYVAHNFKKYFLDEAWPESEQKQIEATLQRPVSLVALAGKVIDTLNTSLVFEIKRNYIRARTKNYVITVPPRWKYRQKRATLKAAELSGIKNVRLIDEPLAAAVFLMKTGIFNPTKSSVSLVIDFGAGTFDVALLEMKESGIKVTYKDTEPFGGTDIDKALLEKIVSRKENSEYSYNRKVLKRSGKVVNHQVYITILDKITTLKHSFSEPAKSTQKRHARASILDATVTLEEFREVVTDELKRIRVFLTKFLSPFPAQSKQIDHVFLVGGSSKLLDFDKFIEETLKPITTQQQPRIIKPENPEWCIVKGAAYLSASDARPDFMIEADNIPQIDFNKNELSLLSGSLPSTEKKELPQGGILIFKVLQDIPKVEIKIFADGNNETSDIVTIVPLHENVFRKDCRISIEYEVGTDSLIRFKSEVLYPRQKIVLRHKVYELDKDDSLLQHEYRISGGTR